MGVAYNLLMYRDSDMNTNCKLKILGVLKETLSKGSHIRTRGSSDAGSWSLRGRS